MIAGKDIYEVFAAIVPLYVAMGLAYGSVRWWRVFTPEQCSGINRFVAVFAVPLLSFHFISSNNPYAMNYHFLAADSLQKLVVLSLLFLYQRLVGPPRLDWTITLFSLATLPNTLVMGIPLLRAMYGDFSASLMVQIVVLQSVLWYTLVLLLFEYRAARALISQHFPPAVAASISSFRVDSDVLSLHDGSADAHLAQDGRLQLVVRRSAPPSVSSSATHHLTKKTATPRTSNLSGVEIYSLQSSREPTPRGSSFDHSDFCAMFSALDGHVSSAHNSSAAAPASKDLHMYVWSASSASPVSEANLRNAVNRAASGDFATKLAALTPPTCPPSHPNAGPMTEQGGQSVKGGGGEGGGLQLEEKQRMPPASVMTRLVLIMVWRKLIRNPNTYSSLIGLVWSLISFRWKIEMPAIITGSIAILSNAGLGMAMFSLGLFMALQPKLIACGNSMAAFAMAVRFLAGPAVIAATSIGIGVRGVLLHVAIVQAALPQGIVPFVFAKEYNCHADILSTSVIFGMLIALPITILYYVLLGL